MPTICFDSPEEYIQGIEETVTYAIGEGIGATFEADASYGGNTSTMTIRSSDLYIIKFNGKEIRDGAYTANKLSRDLSYANIINAVNSTVNLGPAGDDKINFEGANKDIFIICVAEAMRFPPLAFAIAYLLQGVGTVNTSLIKFINQWEQLSRKIIATGRSDLNACSLLRGSGNDRVTGGNCRLSSYDTMRRRIASGNVEQSEVISQLKLMDIYSCNLDIAIGKMEIA